MGALRPARPRRAGSVRAKPRAQRRSTPANPANPLQSPASALALLLPTVRIVVAPGASDRSNPAAAPSRSQTLAGTRAAGCLSTPPPGGRRCERATLHSDPAPRGHERRAKSAPFALSLLEPIGWPTLARAHLNSCRYAESHIRSFRLGRPGHDLALSALQSRPEKREGKSEWPSRPYSRRQRLVYIRRMRRSWSQRVFAGVISLWFAVAVPGIASMPMAESGDTTMAGMPGMPAMGHGGAPQCVTMGAHPSPTEPGGSVPTKQRQHSGCDGACCTPATVTLTAGRLVAIPVVPARVGHQRGDTGAQCTSTCCATGRPSATRRPSCDFALHPRLIGVPSSGTQACPPGQGIDAWE